MDHVREHSFNFPLIIFALLPFVLQLSLLASKRGAFFYEERVIHVICHLQLEKDPRKFHLLCFLHFSLRLISPHFEVESISMPSVYPSNLSRAEHIGSLKRPVALLEKRDQFDQGKCTAEELKAVEDVAIKEEVEKQLSLGIKCVTDGEFRRHM